MSAKKKTKTKKAPQTTLPGLITGSAAEKLVQMEAPPESTDIFHDPVVKKAILDLAAFVSRFVALLNDEITREIASRVRVTVPVEPPTPPPAPVEVRPQDMVGKKGEEPVVDLDVKGIMDGTARPRRRRRAEQPSGAPPDLE